MSQRRNRRISPYHIAERWCGLGEDQEGFKKKIINDDIGHGLVTNKPFLKGDFLLEYRGILSIADDQDDENADYVFHFSHKSTEYRIDASDSNSCLARWVNDDHVHPNSIMKKVAFDNNSPHLCLFALVDLKEGVELTYDYGVKNLPWRQPSLEKEKNIPSSEERDDEDVDDTDADPTWKKSEDSEDSNDDCESDVIPYRVLHTSRADRLYESSIGQLDSENNAGNQEKDITDKAEDTCIKVLTANNELRRKWDKRHFCVFCEKDTPKFARHIQSHHSNEVDVKRIMAFPKKSKNRRDLLELLRNKGNHAHNLQVLREGKGLLIPFKRPTYETPVKDYLPCTQCYAWYVRSDLWKHRKKCVGSAQSGSGSFQSQCSMLLPMPKEVPVRLRDEVFSRMTHDDVSLAVRHDDLIIKLGGHLLSKFQDSNNHYNYVGQKLREMGRLLLQMRSIRPSINCLSDTIDPKVFDDVVRAVNKIAGLDESSGKYKTPSLALKVGHSLKKCSRFLMAEALKNGDTGQKERAEQFGELCSLEWAEKVSTGALKTLYTAKRNRPTIIPLSSDIQSVHNTIQHQMQESMTHITAGSVSSDDFSRLGQAMLAQTVLFNRKRSGEVERMTVENYKKRTGDLNKDVLQGLNKLEKELCKKLTRVEIPGKRGRTVPVLLTQEMKEALDVLAEESIRQDAGVLESNMYLFARPGCTTPYRGCDAVRKFARMSKAEHPENITSTQLRKHVATMSQILCLKDNELDVLATFMGHNIKVHREYYRLPENTLQVAKIAKILLLMEKGQMNKCSGMSLDSINVDLNEACEEDNNPDGDIQEDDTPDVDSQEVDTPDGDSQEVDTPEEGHTPDGDIQEEPPVKRDRTKSHRIAKRSRGNQFLNLLFQL
eukprot:XP_011677358.1 PREDICTED: uncharacterized protein LOC105444594 isoform X2 [Strongylocentrotus purpuratus]